MTSWAGLLIPTFKCGHLKTGPNSWTAGHYPRCKECHRKRTALYRQARGVVLRPSTQELFVTHCGNYDR